MTSKSHTHPSHSETSRLLNSSLSLGVPVPRVTQCIRGVQIPQLQFLVFHHTDTHMQVFSLALTLWINNKCDLSFNNKYQYKYIFIINKQIPHQRKTGHRFGQTIGGHTTDEPISTDLDCINMGYVVHNLSIYTCIFGSESRFNNVQKKNKTRFNRLHQRRIKSRRSLSPKFPDQSFPSLPQSLQTPRFQVFLSHFQ